MKIRWEKALVDYISDDTVSYASIAKKYGVSKQAVVEHASREGWQDLREETRKKVIQKLPEKIGENISDVNARHQKIGLKLQDIGLEALDKFKPMNFREARDTIVLGVTLERKILGLDSEIKTGGNDRFMSTDEFLQAMKERAEKRKNNQ